MNYYRLKVKLPENKTKTYWVQEIVPNKSYWELRRDGSRKEHLIVVDTADIISIEPAMMNMHYGVIEIACCFERREFGKCHCAFSDEARKN